MKTTALGFVLRREGRAGLAAFVLVLLLSMLAGGLVCSASAVAANVWSTMQLTDNDGTDFDPAISGDRVAWRGHDGNDFEIYTWEVGDSSPTQLTDNSINDVAPEVSGDRIVWRGYDGNDYEIFTWEVGDSSPTQLTDDVHEDYGAVISGDRIVWRGYDGNDYEIFTWEVGDSSPTQLTDNVYEDYGAVISGDRIVWRGYDGSDFEILTWQVGDSSSTQITDDADDDDLPDVSGDRVVWRSRDGSDFEIFTWQVGDSAPTQITDDADSDDDPRVSGDRVVWYGDDGNDAEIYTWKVGDSAPTQITSNAANDYSPQISGDQVAWFGYDGSDFEIFTWEVGDSSPTQLTDNTYADEMPRISGGRVVWHGKDGNDYEIFLASKGVSYKPIQGDTRFETAVAASRDAFPGGASCVVIATGRNWPDALGGASLAGVKCAPILLVETDAIPAAVAAEVTRLGAGEAIILGGEGAVGPDVFTALEGLVGSGNVTRIGGATRYETARKIADAVVALNGATTGFVATGADFPDALAAAPLAAANEWPIYLAEDGIPAAMAADGITNAIVLGGTGVVPSDVEGALKVALGWRNVERLWGNDRYQTALTVAMYGCDSCGLEWDGMALATGKDFPDALAGGVLQGSDGSIMLLTDSAALNTDVAVQMADEAGVISEVRYLGGLGAISQSVRDAVEAILE